jgi:hypothetical protein
MGRKKSAASKETRAGAGRPPAKKGAAGRRKTAKTPTARRTATPFDGRHKVRI